MHLVDRTSGRTQDIKQGQAQSWLSLPMSSSSTLTEVDAAMSTSRSVGLSRPLDLGELSAEPSKLPAAGTGGLASGKSDASLPVGCRER